jgi:hypothetical protein
MLESNAVMQVPMFMPIIIGMADPIVSAPVEERDCKTPIEAEEL